MYNEERNPFFSVRKEDVFTNSGIHIANKVALINEETGNVLGLVSPTYEVVTNNSVNNLFGEALKDISIFDIHDHLDSITKKWRRRYIFGADETNVEITKGDSVNIMLEIYNGYDAKTSFGYNLMSYRWICKNGMVMGKKDLFSESYAHFQDSPEKLRNSFTMKFGAYKTVTDKWKEWVNQPFTTKAFESFVNSRDYIGDRVKKAVVDSYEPVLNDQKLDETKWGAFNVLTYLSSHETKAKKGSNIFSSRYNNINRIASDLYTVETDKNGTGLVVKK